MKKYKNRTMYLTLALILFLIGVGYAILTANLTINGTSGIANATWDVHFENPQATANSSVTPSVAPAADPSDKVQSISYTVTFDQPGDVYEFTVDVANRGSIDAMINGITSTMQIGDDVTDLTQNEPPAYLDYYVKYSDETEIAQKQKIVHGTTEELVVHVEFKRNITNAQFEQAVGKSIVFTYGLEYVQADGSEIDVPHPVPLAASTILATAQEAGQLNRIGETNIYIFKGGTSAQPANYVSFNGETWRIIGIYGDQLKIIRVNSSGVPTAPSGFTLIAFNSTTPNPGYANSSLKTSLNTTYYATLTTTAKNMIDEGAQWNVGPVAYNATASTAYNEATTSGTVSSTTHTTPLVLNGKKEHGIGLLASYEFLYATGGGDSCLTTAGNSYSSSCGTAANDWLKPSATLWTLSPSSDYANYSFLVYLTGYVNRNNVAGTNAAVPAVFLKSSVTIASGDGTNPEHAYVLQLNE